MIRTKDKSALGRTLAQVFEDIAANRETLAELTKATPSGDMPPMTMPAPADRPAYMRAIRERLGLTGVEFARLMGVDSGARQIRRWEAKDASVSDQAVILATLLDQNQGAIDVVNRLLPPKP